MNKAFNVLVALLLAIQSFNYGQKVDDSANKMFNEVKKLLIQKKHETIKGNHLAKIVYLKDRFGAVKATDKEVINFLKDNLNNKILSKLENAQIDFLYDNDGMMYLLPYCEKSKFTYRNPHTKKLTERYYDICNEEWDWAPVYTVSVGSINEDGIITMNFIERDSKLKLFEIIHLFKELRIY